MEGRDRTEIIQVHSDGDGELDIALFFLSFDDDEIRLQVVLDG